MLFGLFYTRNEVNEIVKKWLLDQEILFSYDVHIDPNFGPDYVKLHHKEIDSRIVDIISREGLDKFCKTVVRLDIKKEQVTNKTVRKRKSRKKEIASGKQKRNKSR